MTANGDGTGAGGNGLGWSKSEMMIVASARQLAGGRRVLRGHRPSEHRVQPGQAHGRASSSTWCTSPGVFGASPERLPLSIGDPTLVSGSTAVCSMFELFAFYLQAGLVDVGFLGAAQIDRFGNINTTVIGDYAKPKVRLPGLRRSLRDRHQREARCS